MNRTQTAGRIQPTVRRVASSTSRIVVTPKTRSSVLGSTERRTNSSKTTSV